MRGCLMTAAALMLLVGPAAAEPFQEVTVGVPVRSVADAEAWCLKLFGADVESLRPADGVVEFKVAPGVWFQIYEAETPRASGATVRFLVDDIEVAQREGTTLGLQMGAAIAIPGVVTFSELSDPEGNPLGLYDLP